MAGAEEPEQVEQQDEAQALNEIVKWSAGVGRPKWQRDALRRLCEKDELTETDFDEMTALCKGQAAAFKPITKDIVKDPNASGATINLRALHGIQEVNALAEGQRLSFEKSGITVVYGDNGSGKSGYARVLKKVCRARTLNDDQLLRNIYGVSKGPQRGIIDFSASKQNQSEEWEAGKQTTPLLSAVSVFDSGTANVHVDETNDLAYMPFPIRLLERLAQTCQEVKKRLAAEISTLKGQTPAAIMNPKCKTDTATGKMLTVLSGNTKKERVEELATLSVEEHTRLETLRSDLNIDPVKAARHLEALKNRLDVALKSIEACAAAGTKDKAEALKNFYKTYKSAKEAAEAAAKDLFTDDPLPEIGSESWRALWEAARTYSENAAYLDKPYPVTGDDARCVLCQQNLDDEASDRLNRFESFVQAETKRKDDEALATYREALSALDEAELSCAQILKLTSFVADELDDEGLARKLRRFLTSVKWRLRHIRRYHQKPGNLVLSALRGSPVVALTSKSEEIGHRATVLLQEDDSEEYKKLVAELNELEDREWLGGVKEDVLAEIGRREKIRALENASKETGTTAITTKSSEISEHLVTKTLRAKFSQEVSKLGVSELAIELTKKKTKYGVPQFRINLINKPDAHVGGVLSEGEHRCVALAGFLAELATSESHSAIVFDDPVSSLDHMHRDAVATRLAEEGQNRQIIVFTHDIAFLFRLNEECKKIGTHIGFRSVNRGSNLAGYCQNDAPANAQPVEAVIASMQKQLDNQKIQHENGDQAAWYQIVRSLQEQLRTSWERAVEEVLGPVFKRLSNKVNTPGLAKVTAVTIEDCAVMRKAFGRCSELLHSQAEALNSPLPKPEKIQTEIDALKDWFEDIKSRQDKIAAS